MNTGRVWPQLYSIALFELDAKVPDRIAAAETALVRRARKLFQSAGAISKKSMLQMGERRKLAGVTKYASK